MSVPAHAHLRRRSGARIRARRINVDVVARVWRVRAVQLPRSLAAPLTRTFQRRNRYRSAHQGNRPPNNLLDRWLQEEGDAVEAASAVSRTQFLTKVRDASARVRVRALVRLLAALLTRSRSCPQLRSLRSKLGEGWGAVEALLKDDDRRDDWSRPQHLRDTVLREYGTGVARVAALVASMGRAFVEEEEIDTALRNRRRLPAASERLAASRSAPPGYRQFAAASGVDAAREVAAAAGEQVTGGRAARAARTAMVSARDIVERRRVRALERLGDILEVLVFARVPETSHPRVQALLTSRRQQYVGELDGAGLLLPSRRPPRQDDDAGAPATGAGALAAGS